MRSDLVLFPARALHDEALTRAHLKVLYHLGRHADFKTGWAWPSLARLAEASGVNRRTVIRALEVLIAGGYVKKQGADREDGGHGNNRYLVVLDPTDVAAEIALEMPFMAPPSDTPATSPPSDMAQRETAHYPSDTPTADAHYPSDTPQREACHPNTHLTPKETPIGAGASKNGDGGGGKPTWVTPYYDLWVKIMRGKPNVGQLCRFLKPLHDEKGSERVCLVLAYHLYQMVDSSRAAYVSLPKFASIFGILEREALADVTPEIDWVDLHRAENATVPHDAY